MAELLGDHQDYREELHRLRKWERRHKSNKLLSNVQAVVEVPSDAPCSGRNTEEALHRQAEVEAALDRNRHPTWPI